MHILLQARSGSSRLPYKIYEKINNLSVLERCHASCEQSGYPVTVLIPFADEDAAAYCIDHNWLYQHGPELDVLTRYMQATRAIHNQYQTKYFARVTSDCPFISPAELRYLGYLCEGNQYDYITNCLTDSIDGREIDLLSLHAWDWLDKHAIDNGSREHVTQYIKKHIDGFPFSWYQYREPLISAYVPKISIDTHQELLTLRQAYDKWHSRSITL